MVAPVALVADVHALLALAGGGNESAIGIDTRWLLEERRRLLLPHPDSYIVDDIHQTLDRFFVEAPTEIARRRGVGNGAGAERIEKHQVIATHLDVVQHATTAQGVVGQIQDVVRVEVGAVLLQDVQVVVQRPGQSNVLHQIMYDAESAIRHGPDPIRGLVLRSALAELRPTPISPRRLPALSPLEAAGYFSLFSFVETS